MKTLKVFLNNKKNHSLEKNVRNEDKIVTAIQKNVGKWQRSLENVKNNPKAKKILIATSMADYAHAASLDRLCAIALTEMGHKVAFLLCDAELKACQIIKFQEFPTKELLRHKNTPRCEKCSPKINSKFRSLGLPIFTFGKLNSHLQSELNRIKNLEISELNTLEINGVPIGEHSRAGAIRYFASSNLSEEINSKEILYRFIESALIVMQGIEKAINIFQPDSIVAHHGIYVPQGIVTEVARKKNIFLLTWTPSYRRGTFIFSPDESYHHTLVSEPVTQWSNYKLSSKDKKKLNNYMKSREMGTEDWIKFSDSRIEDFESKINKHPYILALTSVTWDAELHYVSRAFPNMKNWLETTLDIFKNHPDHKLLIRIHPAELTSPNKSRERIEEFLNSIGVNELPNVQVIPPDSKLSTYSLIRNAEAVLIYNTKTGIEAAYMGKPVVTAGEAWIKGKGISSDAYSVQDYIEILDNILNDGVKPYINFELAEKYAFHFFFKRMIRLKLFSHETTKDLLPKRALRWEELLSSADPNFREILDSILEKRTPLSKEI